MRRPLLSIAILSLAWTPGLVRAETPASSDRCSADFVEQDVESRVATAGIWANLRRAEGSVQVASRRMLTDAGAMAAVAEPPADACPATCEVDPVPVVVFRSTPAKLRSGYENAARCDALRGMTEAEPLSWRGREFHSLEELSGWIGRFAQGRGGAGEELYRRCDGPCSPRFTWLIHDASEDRIALDAEVVCGHARDREDNTYELTFGLRWSCRAPTAPASVRIGGP